MKIFRNQYLNLLSLALFIVQTFYPSIIWALSGGPSQPEVESFEPVSANQMVDLFSGDFTYNLPLLTVPGPNGGYPINIAYHSGIGMEDEASWVGLGWNLNVGAVNRILNGIPDDFNGQKATQIRKIKPEWNVSVEGANANEFYSWGDTEVGGWESYNANSASGRIVYDNYRGLGIKFSRNNLEIEQACNDESGLHISAINNNSFSMDLSDGIPYVDLKMGKFFKGRLNNYYDKHPNTFYSVMKLNRRLNKLNKYTHASSFLNAYRNSVSASSDVSRSGFSAGVEFTVNSHSVAPYSWSSSQASIKGSYSLRRIPEDKVNSERLLYGFQHSQNATKDAISDCEVNDEWLISKRTPSLPVPVQGNDHFSVSGQGTGGMFRGYRKDVGIYHPPSNIGNFTGGEIGAEIGSVGPSSHGGFDAIYHSSMDYKGPWMDDNGIESLKFKSMNNMSNRRVYFKMIGEQTTRRLDHMLNIGDKHPVAFPVAFRNTNTGGLASIITDIVTNYSADQNDYYEPIPARKGKVNSTGDIDGSYISEIPYNELCETAINYQTSDEYVLTQNNISRKSYLLDSEGDVDFETFNELDYSTTGCGGEQIVSYSVIQPDGSKYVYGIPIFNINQNSASFEVNPANCHIPGDAQNLLNCNVNSKIATYGTSMDDGKVGNVDHQNGSRHFYSEDQLPAYSYAFLLTEVYSTDYVDVTGDGATEDDLGYYCKFNYVKCNDYAWRSPYLGGHYAKGDYSVVDDDMIHVEYGKRQQYYLAEIETKTHKAIFTTSLRSDACPLPSLSNPDWMNNQSEANTFDLNSSADQNSRSRVLTRIDLYSKNDLETPIQSVHFQYSYELCQGVYNFNSVTGSQPHIINAEGEETSGNGKLTLRKLWFTYRNNDKGSLTPYEFHYAGTQANTINPDYSYVGSDRWGSYDDNLEVPFFNVYSNQDDIQANLNSTAWNLIGIDLPSGGKIAVDYESDSYGYVQDMPAMRMFKIVGTSESDGSDGNWIDSNSSTDDLLPINQNHTRIYFEPEAGIGQDEIDKYFAPGMNIYLKAYLDLNISGVLSDLNNDWDCDPPGDYVDCWAKLASSQAWGYDSNAPSPYNYYLNIEKVDYTKFGMEVHPLRLAGWESLRDRSDIFNPFEDDNLQLSDIPGFIVDMIDQLPQMMQRMITFYGWAKLKNLCPNILSSTTTPAFVRLYDPNKTKFGGGHRVSKVTLIEDTWTDDNLASDIYSQEYFYELEGGESSGVAQNEPALGGEENALKQPIYYNDSEDPITIRGKTAFLEEPLCESYYPNESIGYSRVVVRSKSRVNGDQVIDREATPGFSVYEFYTSKDFPVFTSKTNLSVSNNTMRSKLVPIPIVGVGWQVFRNQVYSQGYYVELNDMHGRQKSVAVFPEFPTDVVAEIQPSDYLTPTSKIEYKYKIMPDDNSRISSVVPALDQNGAVVQMTLGETHDFFVHMSEGSSWRMTPGGNFGADGEGLAIVPNFNLNFEYSQADLRTITTTKVVYRTGILEEIRSYVDGSYTTSSNELYDYLTGDPILVKTLNEFEDPIYEYSYSAFRYYEGMADAYNNLGLSYNSVSIDELGELTVVNLTGDYSDLFNPGDILLVGSISTPIVSPDYYQTVYVTNVGTNSVSVRGLGSSELPVSVIDTRIRIIWSGRRNQTSASSGKLITKYSPFDQNNWLAALESQLNAIPFDRWDELQSYKFLCRDESVSFNWKLLEDVISVEVLSGGENIGTISLEFEGLANSGYDGIGDVKLQHQIYPVDRYVLMLPDGQEYICQYTAHPENTLSIITTGCFDVIHAEALTFSDENYDDAVNYGLEASVKNALESMNPYASGIKGIWRPNKSYAYKENRIRGVYDNTQINMDGEYEHFEEFQWPSSAISEEDVGFNPLWTWINKLSKYSPYGFALESQNALGIFDAQLLGYDQSLVVAKSSNARHSEIIYSGFEDSESWNGTQFEMQDLWESQSESHTGKKSLLVSGSNGEIDLSPNNYVTLSPGKYWVSMWVKSEDDYFNVQFWQDGQVLSKEYASPKPKCKIDGWYQVYFMVNLPDEVECKLKLTAGESGAYVDDLRIHPFDASFESYVYDPITLRLVAILDNNNFATIFVYNEEGKLVQKKVETQCSLQTIQISQSNIAHE